ncbi:MAG: B12-binding domain-containing radical SAM protein [Magnetococcales bacterium]|nr:B12-binding domain-containing radical SAM protein [Magnetococcales bacterium]
MAHIVMVQPSTSLTGSFIRMIPLGILYAASRVIRDLQLDVALLDARINPDRWQQDLETCLTPETRIVGFSVMSGFSILESLKITRWIKQHHQEIIVVWGGPHPTFSPEDTLAEPTIDFVIRGYGRDAFHDLVAHVWQRPEAPQKEDIQGLGWRNEWGETRLNPESDQFEFMDYQEIPYHLIADFSVYRHIDGDAMVFPLYSVMGCPYKCAFCSTPAQLAGFRKKWVPYATTDVVNHIRMVKERFGASYIYFIDEDSFVNLAHVEAIVRGVREAGLQLKLGFRGARVNEIKRMSDDFLEMLVNAGTSTMHVGVECGSDRILNLMGKHITVADILEINRKLARHPQLRIFYNFIVGYPTETFEETRQTRDLVLRLMADNPSCFIIPLNKPRPLPRTRLYELALNHGYRPPQTLLEWGSYDVESSDYNPEWLSASHNRCIRMMFLAMYFIDNKIHRLHPRNTLFFKILRLLARIYRPIAMLRFRYGIHQFLVEDWVFRLLNRLLPSHY